MDVEQVLIDYFIESTNEVVTADTPLVEGGVIDSMGVLALIEFIEGKYALDLDLDDLTIENFATIKDIKNFIQSKQA